MQLELTLISSAYHQVSMAAWLGLTCIRSSNSLTSFCFFFTQRLSRYFSQSGACGKYPRRHLLYGQCDIPCPSFRGAVQPIGPSYAGCRDSFPIVAPELL